MKKRLLEKDILAALEYFPAVALLGSRQVGKTTLAKEIQKYHKKSIYLDLELDSDIEKLQNAEFFLQEYNDQLVIIDEIQRQPNLFPLLRALIDKKKKPGRFLLLGSASGDLLRQSSESLAGRISYFELSPFLLSEISEKENFKKLWLRGGYPESFLAPNNDLSMEWRRHMIQTFIERDIPQLGISVDTKNIKRFIQMLVHVHGQLWNGNMMAKSLGLSNTAIQNYLHILEQTFFVRKLLPHHNNIKKRLIKSPKIYLRDTGFLHTLVGISTWDHLLHSPAFGNSWEGFIIEQLIHIAPKEYEVSFFRTAAGAEMDLVFSKAGIAERGVEIKSSLSPKLTKGFWNAKEDLNLKTTYVIYPGDESYKIQESVYVISVRELEKIFA